MCNSPDRLLHSFAYLNLIDHYILTAVPLYVRKQNNQTHRASNQSNIKLCSGNVSSVLSSKQHAGVCCIECVYTAMLSVSERS